MISYFKKPKATKKQIAEWAKAVKERDGYTCQICGRYDENAHAHHIVSRGADISKVIDLDNGKTLCFHCHHKVHSGEIKIDL